MKKGLFLFLSVLLFSLTSSAGIKFYNGSNKLLGVDSEFKCGTGTSCSVVAGKVVSNVTGLGVLQTQTNATATTITAAQCGSTFKNTGAVVINLPEASAVIGCRLTFITANASNFDINPDDADQILVVTNAVGDSIRNATLGNSITLEAISAVNWAQVAAIGTWSDNN